MNTMPPMPPTPPLTKKQKIIIISIAVFLLFSYLGTLGLFATQEQEEETQSSEINLPDWTKALSSVMSLLADKATLEGLTCNGSPVSSEFELSSSAPRCKITFQSSNLPDYESKKEEEDSLWKTEVEVLSPEGTTIYTKYESSSCSGKTEGGMAKTRNLPNSALGLTHLTSKTNKEDGKVQTGQYYSESSLNCWLEQEDTSVSFTILQAGESLIISCGPCPENATSCTCSTPITAKLVE